MTYDEMIAVIQAAKEGKKIERRSAGRRHSKESWSPIQNPSFDFYNFDYRVKPDLLKEALTVYETARFAGRQHAMEAVLKHFNIV